MVFWLGTYMIPKKELHGRLQVGSFWGLGLEDASPTCAEALEAAASKRAAGRAAQWRKSHLGGDGGRDTCIL